MRADNPAGIPCTNIEKGPIHDWLRLADGTAYCRNCGVQLSAELVTDAWPAQPQQVNKQAGGNPVEVKPRARPKPKAEPKPEPKPELA